MPRLPGPANVPQVAPPRGVPVNAPAAAFGAPENEAFTNLAMTAGRLVDQRLSRIEALNHAKAENTLIERSQQRLLELNSESDLSLPDAQAEYAQWLDQQKQELLTQFGGRSKQQAFLLRSLDNVSARFRGRASALGEEIALQNMDQALSRQLGTYETTAQNDPTRVVDLLTEWSTQVRDVYGPAMPPGMESATLTAGSEQIMKAALRPFLVTGDVGAAREMLSQYAPLLPDDSVAELGGYIREQAAEQDEIIRWVNTMRSMGIEPTIEQILAKSDALPPAPLVQVGPGGSPMPVTGTPAPGFQYVFDPASNSFQASRIPGGPAETEAAATAAGRTARTQSATQVAEAVTTNISRIFDVLEDQPILGPGPVSGRVGAMLPGSAVDRINILLDPIRANVGFAQLQAMRDASPTGGALGQVAVQELSFLQNSLGNLDTRLPPDQLAENLVSISEVFARTVYGSDAELDIAVEQGRVTPAQADAAAMAREETVGRFRQRAQSIIAPSEEQAQPTARPSASEQQFRSVVRAIRQNPDALSPDEISGMQFSREQMEALAVIYDEMTAADATTAAPEAETLIQEFMAANPDAATLSEEMAAIIEAGEAATLEDAYRIAKERAGGP